METEHIWGKVCLYVCLYLTDVVGQERRRDDSGVLLKKLSLVSVSPFHSTWCLCKRVKWQLKWKKLNYDKRGSGEKKQSQNKNWKRRVDRTVLKSYSTFNGRISEALRANWSGSEHFSTAISWRRSRSSVPYWQLGLGLGLEENAHI